MPSSPGSLSGWPCGRGCPLQPGFGRTTATCAAAGGSRRWSRCTPGSTPAARCRSRAAGCICTASRSPTCSGPDHGMLTRERILALFTELDDELCRAGIRGDVFIVGGAAMTIAYDARPATRDVDGIWHPAPEVRSAAARVAARHDDIDSDWLNDAVKGFLPSAPPTPSTAVYEGSHLTVSVPRPEYLLA